MRDFLCLQSQTEKLIRNMRLITLSLPLLQGHSAPDGSILPCTDKSKLIHCLQKLPIDEEVEAEQYEVTEERTSTPNKRIAIVDGMVVVQKMTAMKKGSVKTVKDLGECFNERIMNLTSQFLTHTRLTHSKRKPDRRGFKEGILFNIMLQMTQRLEISQ